MATTTYATGTILTVRGYLEGKQLPARRAVVVGDVYGRTAVWFYGQGAPRVGVTVQPLYADSVIRETGKTMRDLAKRTLGIWERKLHGSMLHSFGWEVYAVRQDT